VAVCDKVQDVNATYPSDLSGAAIEMILDVTSKLGVLNSILCFGQGNQCWLNELGSV